MDDILQISNPSSINNGDYLICGNDNGAVTFSAHVSSDCTIKSIMARDWKFRHVGDFGTVNLRFDLTGVAGFNGSDLRLLVDVDGNGIYDETPIQGTYTAPYFTASAVTIPNGAKATLCTAKSHYYAVTGGLTSGAIWSDSPTGTPGFLDATCATLDLTIKAVPLTPGVANSGVVENDLLALTCRNITVEAGAAFNSGALASQNIHVNGDITINGTWSKGNCTLNMEADVAQTVNGTRYLEVQNWIITNTAGVTINCLGANVYGNLGVAGGGVLNTGNKLTLWSDILETINLIEM
jgi:hypothetical protein